MELLIRDFKRDPDKSRNILEKILSSDSLLEDNLNNKMEANLKVVKTQKVVDESKLNKNLIWYQAISEDDLKCVRHNKDLTLLKIKVYKYLNKRCTNLHDLDRLNRL